MNAQLALAFESMPAPRGRRRDPATSHEAASRNREVLRGQAAAVLALIRRYPGRTACELAQLGDMDRHAVSRRTADLERHGTVRKGEARVCSVRGSRQVTWDAV